MKYRRTWKSLSSEGTFSISNSWLTKTQKTNGIDIFFLFFSISFPSCGKCNVKSAHTLWVSAQVRMAHTSKFALQCEYEIVKFDFNSLNVHIYWFDRTLNKDIKLTESNKSREVPLPKPASLQPVHFSCMECIFACLFSTRNSIHFLLFFFSSFLVPHEFSKLNGFVDDGKKINYPTQNMHTELSGFWVNCKLYTCVDLNILRLLACVHVWSVNTFY